MSEQEPELEAFSKFIVAIEPWLGEVVLVGGWAHRLYRLDPRARKLEYLPLTTLDGDVAVPRKLKKEESANFDNLHVTVGATDAHCWNFARSELIKAAG
jgi:hypothetical protein